MEMCVILQIRKGKFSVAESAPERRNFRLKFQYFSLDDTPAPDTHCGRCRHPAAPTQGGHFGRARGKRPQCRDTNCDNVGRPVFLTALGGNRTLESVLGS